MDKTLSLLGTFISNEFESKRLAVVLDRRLKMEIKSNLKLLDTTSWYNATDAYKLAVVQELNTEALYEWLTFAERKGLTNEVEASLMNLYSKTTSLQSIANLLSKFPDMNNLRIRTRISNLKKDLLFKSRTTLQSFKEKSLFLRTRNKLFCLTVKNSVIH